MITIYCTDENNFFNKEVTQDAKKPFPKSCTLEKPPHGKVVKLVNGYWIEAVKPEPNATFLNFSEKEEKLREERNKLLLDSDWTQLPDSPLSSIKKDEWKVYRQALRDIFTSNTDIFSIQLPQKPE